MNTQPHPTPVTEAGCSAGCDGVATGNRFALGLHPTLLPALAIAALPKCPLCWAAWIGGAAAFGLGGLDFSPRLLLTAVALLAILLAVAAWHCWRRGQLAPIVLFVLGGALVFGGRLAMESPPVSYTGLVVLLIASVAARRGQVLNLETPPDSLALR